MIDKEEFAQGDPREANYYKIRKEVVGVGLLALTCWAGYMAHDYFSHLNWPPHDGRNHSVVKSMDCPIMSYNLLRADIETIPAIGGFSGHLDRKMFFEKPSCAATLYLSSEGTGIRSTYYIYDKARKRQTAVIEITHAHVAEGDLK